MTIFEKIGQFKNKGSFEGWLKRITIHTVLQKYRDKSSLQLVHEVNEQEDIEEFNLDTTIFSIDVLLGFIQQLPERYRLVFNLYVLDNYSHKEISKMLAISIGTSKSNLSRARKILKEQLESHQKKTQKTN